MNIAGMPKELVRDSPPDNDRGHDICQEMMILDQVRVLDHYHYGITELQTRTGVPMVAYADRVINVVKLCRHMEQQNIPVYIGVQPRPATLHGKSPNTWRPAYVEPFAQIARDGDIQMVTSCCFEIRAISNRQLMGYPATEQELALSLRAACMLVREPGFALSSTICCSGTAHYVLAPVATIVVNSPAITAKFIHFCQKKADDISQLVHGVKITAGTGLIQVMPVIGSPSGQRTAVALWPQRQPCLMTPPFPVTSVMLREMILSTELPETTTISYGAMICHTGTSHTSTQNAR